MKLLKSPYILFSLVFLVIVLSLAFFSDKISVGRTSNIQANQAAEKLYIALEEEGAVAVVDTKTNSLLGKIDLTDNRNNSRANFAAHNVQVAPDGQSVWVTANFMGLGSHGEETAMDEPAKEEKIPDQVIVIDPKNDQIVERINTGVDQHLAHVVVSDNGKSVFATAQESSSVYRINAETYEVEKTLALAKDSLPHGLRLSSDNTQAYIALISGKGIAVLDTKTNIAKTVQLSGSAVQTAIIPNSPVIASSVYDTKEVAFYDPIAKQISYVKLPAEAEGPIQSYATPDGKFLYVADQGYYFGKPTSDYVYKVDVAQKQIVAKIQAGVAPHGVVVSADGKRAYITNLLSNDVSVIDTSTDKEIVKIPVGKMPNGISLWSHQYGGTP